jgi:uncharacterized protein YceH (UPF0502 family)
VIEAHEADLLVALEGLKALSLVFEGGGSRVVKFEHNTARVLHLPGAAVALLAVLMLRGPQTSAELRLNTERLHRFADISSVEGFLEELAAKPEPLAVKLARAPGEREARWAQLLCGAVRSPARAEGGDDALALDVRPVNWPPSRPNSPPGGEVAELKALVQRLARELGMS